MSFGDLDEINGAFGDFSDHSSHPFRSVDTVVPLTEAAAHASVMRMVVESDDSIPEPSSSQHPAEKEARTEGATTSTEKRKKEKKPTKFCSNCKRAPWRIMCPYCGEDVFLCTSCDLRLHSLKIFSGHVRRDASPASLKCANCDVMKPSVWCTNCSVMLCSGCDSYVHSMNVFYHHERLPPSIEEAMKPAATDPEPHPLLYDPRVHKVKRGRPKKDAGAPKQAMTAYMYFCADYRAQLHDNNLGETIVKPFKESGKAMGEMWKKKMTTEEKKKYVIMAKEDRKRYNDQMRQFRNSESYDGPDHYNFVDGRIVQT